MGDLLDALGRHAPAAQDVAEKRSHISWSEGAAEGDHQDCVEGP
jgi:hypothetical protein